MTKNRPFGKCIVTIKSKEGLRHIENICFRNNIEWCGSGKEHIPHRCNSDDKMGISIDNDISLTSDLTHFCYDDFAKYTVTQFVAKYGKKSKYRIKTKKEFIDEFGFDWRNKTQCGFVNSMDKFLGRILTGSEAHNMLVNDKISISSWNISKRYDY